MQVEYKCPHCAAVVKAPPSLEGEYGECPKCKKDVDRWPAPVTRPIVRQQPPPLQPHGSQPPALAQTAVWYYMAGENRRGPVTEAQLKALVEIGSLRPADLVWRDGMAGWVEASRLPGLFPLPAAQPPAIPPPQPLVVQYAPPPIPVAPSVTESAGRETQECPYCSESISRRAKRCPICGETVDAAMREAEEARKEAKEARRDADDARRESRRRRRDRREVHYHERDRRPTCPHVLHLVLTVLTLGAWLPIWLIHWIIVECS